LASKLIPVLASFELGNWGLVDIVMNSSLREPVGDGFCNSPALRQNISEAIEGFVRILESSPKNLALNAAVMRTWFSK
jgi:hypothetical protein